MEKYLIFDFDGVIGDTWDVFIDVLIRRRRFKTREEAISSMKKYFSSKPNHIRGHTLTDEEMQIEFDKTVKTGEMIDEHGFPLFTDFVAQIESINTHYKAIVSRGSQNYIIPKMSTTNINPTHILAFEDHHSKEKKIETICNDWNVSVKDVYYFTDSLADVYELQNMISKDKLIGVSWGFCTEEDLLKELLPEHILNIPSDIHKVL